MTELTSLEIRILLKCRDNPLGKKNISQLYRAHSHAQREQALESLIEKGLLLLKPMPTPTSKKIPIYYWITESGKAWVSSYLKNFPANN